MTFNVMKPAEGIYTTSEMPKVFTLPVKCRRYLHQWKTAGVFTLKGEMTRVFTLHCMGYLHRMKSTGGI